VSSGFVRDRIGKFGWGEFVFPPRNRIYEVHKYLSRLNSVFPTAVKKLFGSHAVSFQC
jgi:hypothetical protein